ncbi:MAG: electron transfer flavoprotein subunit beta/FixA family protein [Eubacteriales bacterium]
MNILVCVKQVPDTTSIKIDPVKHTLIRTGVPSIVNPYDGYALEMAARIKDKVGGRITALSMGPEMAKDALKECISVGADDAYLISDRVFGGSDTLATSCIISTAIKLLEERNGAPFDLIFCGKQAIDGDTGQVGPEIAEHLDRALITYAYESELDGDTIKVRRESDEGYDIVTAKLPAVVTVEKTPYEPRYPSIKSKMAARKAVIPTLTSEEVIVDENRRGLKGSPTKVKSTYTAEIQKNGKTISGIPGDEAGTQLVDLLYDAGILK